MEQIVDASAADALGEGFTSISESCRSAFTLLFTECCCINTIGTILLNNNNCPVTSSRTMSEENSHNIEEGGEEIAFPEGEGQPVRPKLNVLNFLNVIFYIANVVLVNVAFVVGLPNSNTGSSEKYQVSDSKGGEKRNGIDSLSTSFRAIPSFLPTAPFQPSLLSVPLIGPTPSGR